MTLRLAAFQHFCGQVARAGGVWADALLTSFSPLTYERGDALQAFEEENEVHEPSGPWYQGPCPRCGDPWCDTPAAHGECVCPTDFPVGVSTSPPIVPPTGLDPSPTIIESAPPPPVDDEGSSEEIAAFPRRPSEGHPTSISLPMFKFSDLVEIAAPYIGLHDGFYSQDRKHYACRCGQWFNSFEDHADHVAELVVSALTAELTGLAFDQSHPQPIRCVVDDCPQEFDTRELLNTHSYQSHLQANPFKTSTDPLVKYSRYPGVDEAGDFKWFGITTTSPKPK